MAGKLGKKIDTWEVMTEAGKLQILVYMTPGQHGTFSFTAVCDQAVPRYYRNMPNVNDLKADATKQVKQNARLVWEKRLLVRTSGRAQKQDPDGVSGREISELQIDWQVIEVGKRPDGEYLHRYLEDHGPYGTRIQHGLPETREFDAEAKNKRAWLDDPEDAIVMLPYTPENVAALTNICAQLGNMALGIANLMGPAAAELTLVGININNPLRLELQNVEDKTVVTEATSRPGSSAASGGKTKKGRGTRTVASGAAAKDA